MPHSDHRRRQRLALPEIKRSRKPLEPAARSNWIMSPSNSTQKAKRAPRFLFRASRARSNFEDHGRDLNAKPKKTLTAAINSHHYRTHLKCSQLRLHLNARIARNLASKW
jgi:hypothetical protein